MKLDRHVRALLAVGAGVALWAQAPSPAAAEWSPSQAVRWIVPAPPGGSTDLTARLLQEPLTKALGQPIVVENRAGGAGVVAAEVIAQAPPDGSLVGMIYSSHAGNATLVQSLPFDPVESFTPIAFLWRQQMAISVNPGLGIRTLGDLIERAKADPSAITYGSYGNGSAAHFAGALLAQASGAPLTHAPYRGTGPAVNDVVAGHIQAVVTSVSSTVPQAKEGRVLPLATTGPQRTPALEGVPTVAETYPGFDMTDWSLVVGPAGMPAEIVDRLRREIYAAVASEAVAARFATLGMETAAMSSEEVGRFVEGQIVLLRDLIRTAGITAD